MTYNEKVEFLKNYKYLKAKIKALLKEREFYQNQRIKYAGSIIRPSSSTNSLDNGFSFVVATLSEIEYDLSCKIKQAREELNEVVKAIESIEEVNQRTVLMLHYINGHTFERIAKMMPYSSRHYVSELHKIAITRMSVTNRNK